MGRSSTNSCVKFCVYRINLFLVIFVNCLTCINFILSGFFPSQSSMVSSNVKNIWFQLTKFSRLKFSHHKTFYDKVYLYILRSVTLACCVVEQYHNKQKDLLIFFTPSSLFTNLLPSLFNSLSIRNHTTSKPFLEFSPCVFCLVVQITIIISNEKTIYLSCLERVVKKTLNPCKMLLL